MGYRLYLSKISKTEKEKYKKYTTFDKFSADFDGIYDIPSLVVLYELGKCVDDSNWEKQPFFEFNNELIKDGDYEFWIISKKILGDIIESYRKDIAEYYTKFVNILEKLFDNKKLGEEPFSEEQTRIILRENYLTPVRIRASEWNDNNYGIKPYYLDESPEECDGFLCRSWQKEYAIFNLVYIYRTFNFDKDYLILYGF